ncbi:MAG: flagellar basal body rod protein FlgC [Oscillospiraceae bacterium]|jgi:flagellar basal-body rod protein FlgC|nr:flagellar basal body rod protein FlgC [Oscillospiraceae bacterium]
MGIFRSMEISASGMSAQRFRMDVISQNISNEDNTRTADGSPYRRRVVIFQEKNDPYLFSNFLQAAQDRPGGTGVRAVKVVEDHKTDFKMVYDPSHPDADVDGYVRYPNVDREQELVDFLSALRSYEANVTALNNFKNMAMKALEIAK